MYPSRLLTILLLLAFTTAGCTGYTITIAPATPQPAPASMTFPTPEDAITHYLQGVSERDAAKILQASAIDEMAEGFDFEFLVDRTQTLIPSTIMAPTTDPFYVELNKARNKATLLGAVKLLAFSLLSEEEISARPITQPGAERVRAFVTDVDPSRLSGLIIVKIAIPEPESILSYDSYVENTAKIAKIYGADEWTERIVLLSFEGNTYLSGFTLLRYGDNWKISDQSSIIANTEPGGTATPITPEEFDQITSPD